MSVIDRSAVLGPEFQAGAGVVLYSARMAGIFRAAEIGESLSESSHAERVPKIRERMIVAQQELKDRRIPVALVIAGDDQIGCDGVINILNTWGDPRLIDTNAFDERTQDEAERPRFWRYWRALPAAGRLGLFESAWNFDAIVGALTGEIDELQFERRLDEIQRFERTLAAEGTVIVKLWLHVPRDELAKRIERARHEPAARWRFRQIDEQVLRVYSEAMKHVERLINETSRAHAPWHVIESTCARHRDTRAAELLLNTIEKRLETLSATPATPVTPDVASDDRHTILDTIDLTHTVDKPEYEQRLGLLQARLEKCSCAAHDRDISAVLVFEGWDAAGKGGAIRRLAAGMHAQMYTVIPVSAPSDEDRAHHYLWRFWRHLPRRGQTAIFDRSWYGRVLVERVEGYATIEQWQRAYSEIRDFEGHLVEAGVVLSKFWLQIDAAEQLKRFKKRESVAFKRHKITQDDWRNRERRLDYEVAVSDMVARTSTSEAPWTIVPANCKRHARLEVLSTVCERFERAIEGA